MAIDSINNTVIVPEGYKIKTIRATMGLRWSSPSAAAAGGGHKILQQAWECIEDGSIEWKNVPLEIING